MLNIPHRKSYDQGLLNQSTSLSSVQKSLSTIKPNPVFFFFCFYIWLFQMTVHLTYGNTQRDNFPKGKYRHKKNAECKHLVGNVNDYKNGK